MSDVDISVAHTTNARCYIGIDSYYLSSVVRNTTILEGKNKFAWLQLPRPPICRLGHTLSVYTVFEFWRPSMDECSNSFHSTRFSSDGLYLEIARFQPLAPVFSWNRLLRIIALRASAGNTSVPRFCRVALVHLYSRYVFWVDIVA